MKTITDKTSYEDLIAVVTKAVKELYTLRRTKKQSFDYEANDGYRMHNSVACTSSVEWQLSQEGLAYHRERGRKPIDVILLIAYQLGFSRAMIEMNQKIDYEREMSAILMASLEELKETTMPIKQTLCPHCNYEVISDPNDYAKGC